MSRSDLRQDERGSALILVVLLTGAFAVLLAIVLNASSSGFTVQSTVKAKADDDVTTRGALDEATRMLQGQPDYGREGASVCGSTNPSFASTLFQTTTKAGKTLKVTCYAATSNSGHTLNGLPGALPVAIRTTGGTKNTGALYGPSATVKTATKTGSSAPYTITFTLLNWPNFNVGDIITVGDMSPTDWNIPSAPVTSVNAAANQFTVTTNDGTAWTAATQSVGTASKAGSREPFCQNFEVASDNVCEAGLWVGPGNDDKGVAIRKTSPSVSTQTLIESNSSIVINKTAGVQPNYDATADGPYTLKVQGQVTGRYDCDHDIGQLGNYQLEPGWDPTSQQYQSFSTIGNPSPTNSWAKCSSDTVSTLGDPWQTPIYWHRIAQQGSADPHVTNPGANTGLPVRTVPSCPAPTSSLNFVELLPGRYTDAVGINNLFNSCKGLFYFNPDPTGTEDALDANLHGVFYFDLPAPFDSGPQSGSQVIAGSASSEWTPPSFTTPTAKAARACDMAATGCTATLQTGKVMKPTSANPANTWPTTNQSDALIRDNIGSTGTGTGNNPTITLSSWGTPPPSASLVMGKVILLVTHQETQGSNWAANYPRVTITEGAGNWNGKCSIELPKSYGSFQTHAIDITQGCLKAKLATYDPIANTYGSWISAPTAPATCAATSSTCLWTNATQAGSWKNDPDACPVALPAGQIGPGCGAVTGQNLPGEKNSYWLGNAFDTNGANFKPMYEISGGSAGAPIQGMVDGMELRLDYLGLPAPSFPGACTPNNSGGVQWMFGNRSILNWGGGNGWVEICGSYDDPDIYGMAIYGLYGGVVAPPATIRSGGEAQYPTGSVPYSGDPGTLVTSYNAETYGTDSTNTGKNGDIPQTTTNTNMGALADTESSYTSAQKVSRNQLNASATATNSSGASLPCGVSGFQLLTYTNGVAGTPQAINPEAAPSNDGTRCRGVVADAMGTPDVSNAPAGPPPSSATSLVANWSTNSDSFVEMQVPSNFIPDDAQIVRVEMKIRHREGQVPASGQTCTPAATNIDKLVLSMSGTSTWSSNNTDDFGPPYANTIGSLTDPKSDPSLLKSYQAQLQPTDDCGNWKTFDFGRFLDPNDSTHLNEGWKFERTMTYGVDGVRYTDGLNTPAAVNGTKIRLTASSSNTLPKHMEIDQMQLIVQYRPGDSLKPLSGCSTIRYYQNPETAGAEGVDGWWRAPTDGVDRRVPDWTSSKTISGTGNNMTTTFFGDGAYTASASGTSYNDNQSCPLLKTNTGTGALHLHLSGAAYAPTAAIDLRGVNNGAPMASNGIIARQLTLYQWTGSGRFAQIGGEPPQYVSRDVYLTATVDGNPAERRRVTIDDNHGGNPGQAGITYWAARGPGAS